MTENVTHIFFFHNNPDTKKRLLLNQKFQTDLNLGNNRSGPDFLTVQYTHCVLIDRLK